MSCISSLCKIQSVPKPKTSSGADVFLSRTYYLSCAVSGDRPVDLVDLVPTISKSLVTRLYVLACSTDSQRQEVGHGFYNPGLQQPGRSALCVETLPVCIAHFLDRQRKDPLTGLNDLQ